jgi:outer membrane protein assembly factor BamB
LSLLGLLPALSVFADPSGGTACSASSANWQQWRGPLANGVSPSANPPIHWSETNNIRWKIALPGKGHSSPIIFGDSIYVLFAMPVGEAQKPVYDDAPGVHDSVPVTHRHQFVALAVSRRDGKISWLKSLRD